MERRPYIMVFRNKVSVFCHEWVCWTEILYLTMKFLIIFLVLTVFPLMVKAQTQIPLYAGQVIPNSLDVPDAEIIETGDFGRLRISKVSIPTLTVYLPSKEQAIGIAVIICPGGGYSWLSASHEGSDVAEEFVKKGIAAFVLKYRLPSDETMVDKTIGPLQDAQRAIQLIRENAGQWNVSSDQVGILGFSAGGHLASTAGTHFDNVLIPNPIQTSLRPDFMILVYPVISLEPEIGHLGSSKNLLGDKPSQELVERFSNQKQVTKNTPPTYLVHAKDDHVKIENSYVFEEALRSDGVAVETTYFDKGGHGFGMVNKKSEIKWMDEVERWLKNLHH